MQISRPPKNRYSSHSFIVLEVASVFCCILVNLSIIGIFVVVLQTKTRFFENRILETEINFLNMSAKRLQKC